MDKTELLNSVDRVFSGLPYPHQRDFYAAIAHMDYHKYVDMGKQKRWNEMSRDELTEYYDFLYFLDPDATAYYLPTYMKLMLEVYSENYEDEIFLEQCGGCFVLSLSHSDDRSKIIGELSSRQIEFIMDFMHTLREFAPDLFDDADTERALRNLERAIAGK